MSVLLSLTLFGSVALAYILLGIFLLICFIADSSKNGFGAFVSLLIVTGIFYFWGVTDSIIPFFTFKTVGIYLGVGLLYSIVRTFFEGRKIGEIIKDLPEEKPKEYPYRNKESEKAIHVEALKGNVFRWWFMFPISLSRWIVTDLLNDTWALLYSKMKSIYNYILEIGIKSIK